MHSTSRRASACLFPLISLCLLLATSPPAAGQADRQRPVEQDIYGRPVTSADGRRISYGQAETEGLASLAPAARPAQKGANPGNQLAPNDFQLAWHQVEFGVGIGSTGLVFVDWDGAGWPDLIAGGGTFGGWPNTYWYTVENAGGALETGFATTEYLDDITAILAVDRDGDGDQELLVAHGKTFEFWDAEGGGQPALVASATTTATEIRGLEYADVDGDGRNEFVFCSGSDLKVQDSVTGATDHQRLGIGCSDVAVGNVDLDPQLEIVVGNDTAAGVVIDGAGFGTQWSNPTGFGKLVRIGDVDGDGLGEIVAGFRWYWARVFDAVSQSQQLAIPVDLDLAALRLIDVTGEGRPEIVYGDAQWGEIHVLDGVTGGQLGLAENPEHGVTDLAWGDSDHDGAPELHWGAGFSSSGKDILYAYDLVADLQEASSVDHNGPNYGFAAADLDGDGRREIVHSVYSSNSAYDGGLVYLRDAASRAVEAIKSPTGPSDYSPRQRVAIGQLDGDAALEIAETRDYRVGVFDGVTLAQQWTASAPYGYTLMGLAIGDLDGDGYQEVVVSTRTRSIYNGFVYVYDAATGGLEWQSANLGAGYLDHLRLANVDGDPALEIVLGNDGGELQILDGATHARQLLSGNLALNALDTADLDGNGVAEIYIGTSTGALRRIDPATGAILTTYGTYGGGAIQGLAALDADGDQLADLAFTAGGKLNLRDGGSGALVWQTARLGSDTGHYDSLRAGDFDHDGDLEIWLSLGRVGQMIFERPRGNTAPVVTIGSPAADNVEITVGDSLSFSASALDYEQGDLAAGLVWTSSLAGPIGSGPAFTTGALGVGTHVVTATAADGFGESGQDSVTVRVRTLPVTVTFVSIGAEDGYLFESSENSEVGNYAAANQWRIGDGNNDRQYRSLLSFDTSTLPDDAIVQTAKVRVRRYNLTNTDPFATHGSCLVDVKSGFFGASAALENADFEAPADAVAAGALSPAVANLDWSEGLLGGAGRAAVSRTGRTQLKVRFALDDNDDNQEDYLNYFGGDNTNADYRPKLVITYQQ